MDTPVDTATLHALFERQRAAWLARRPDHAQRMDDLARLREGFKRRLDELVRAMDADFGRRSRHESLLTDGMTVLHEIDLVRSRLRRWMRPQRRGVSPWFWPARAQVLPQPLGVVGVIVPWNYPLYLALGPLVDALTAGNRVLIKMSEYTPRTAAAVATLLAEALPGGEAQVALGEVALAQAFASLPFDHLLFTGSTAVGREVMRLASAQLTPVTLELGGKSPVLIAPGHDVARAAACIAQGKLLNAGQTCVAPDYVLLPRGARAEFVRAFAQAVAASYPTLADNPDYTSIIHPRHWQRLHDGLAEARAAGAQTHACVGPDSEAALAAARKIAPHLLWDAPADCQLLREEIFGPILPLVEYEDWPAALAYVNARPRPLALYLFDHDRQQVQAVLRQTIAGGVVVNDTLLHVVQDGLPFGGVGASGMGQYHGHDGFLTFSKLKPVLYQSRWNAMPWLRPPYGRLARWLQALMLR